MNSDKSRVVVVRSKKVINSSGKVDLSLLQKMVARGLSSLTSETDFRDALFRFYSKKQTIGIKVNCLGGKMVATHPELCITTVNLFEKAGFKKKKILIWERSTQELDEIGYPVNYEAKDLLCKKYGFTSFSFIGPKTKVQSIIVSCLVPNVNENAEKLASLVIQFETKNPKHTIGLPECSATYPIACKLPLGKMKVEEAE